MHSPLVAFLTPVAFTLPGGAFRTFQVLLEGNAGPVWEGHLAGSQRVLWEAYSGERQHTEEIGGSFFKKILFQNLFLVSHMIFYTPDLDNKFKSKYLQPSEFWSLT